MGRRIRAATTIIRELRRSELKYSFEHMVVNVLLGVACLILTILGEHRLWWTFIAVLFISLGVQGLRVWWLRQRWDREDEERLRQAMEDDVDA